MRAPESTRSKIIIISAITMVTITIHYGWFEPLLGHSHWIHAIHGRLCYIPIVIAAAWFGLRGGLYTATVISLLVLPYSLGAVKNPHELANELTEIVFYFSLGILIGVLVDREIRGRLKKEEAEARVERSQKLSIVGQLAASVAHEIKNPLASIKGAADILTANDTSRSDREEFSGILQREVRRIDGTVTEFLEFARPKETKTEKLNLTESIRVSLRQLESEARQQGVAIRSDLEDDVIVDADAEKLHQLTLNLVLNAIHACNDGGAVMVWLGSKDDKIVNITITDTGVGMSRDQMASAFEPFFTTKATGTGLGLSVVKDIVDDHEGTITIDSAPNEGATVSILLPLYLEK